MLHHSYRPLKMFTNHPLRNREMKSIVMATVRVRQSCAPTFQHAVVPLPWSLMKQPCKECGTRVALGPMVVLISEMSEEFVD